MLTYFYVKTVSLILDNEERLLFVSSYNKEEETTQAGLLMKRNKAHYDRRHLFASDVRISFWIVYTKRS